MKKTKRKGFNFFRSYYDVYNELDSNEDKVAFIDALLDRQFLGEKPQNLKGMAKFAYISQTNSIDKQVKGFEDKQNSLNTDKQDFNPFTGEFNTPYEGVEKRIKNPTQQEKEKEKEKEKEEGEGEIKKLINDDSLKISINRFIELYPFHKDHIEVLKESNNVNEENIISRLDDFKKNRISNAKPITTSYGEFCSHFKNWFAINKNSKPVINLNTSERDKDLVYFYWEHEGRQAIQTIDKSKSKDYFKNQELGGYIAKVI